MLAFLGILAAVISTLGFIPYVRDILRGTTKPQRSTWLIWTILSILALFSQLAAGAKWSLVLILAQAISNLLIVGLSIKRGTGGFARQDHISLLIAAIGLGLWIVTSDPLLAIISVLVADAAGAWLTIAKAYADPDSETLITWIIDAICFGLAAIAVGHWYFELIVFPLYGLVANGLTVGAIYLGRKTNA